METRIEVFSVEALAGSKFCLCPPHVYALCNMYVHNCCLSSSVRINIDVPFSHSYYYTLI